MRIQLTDKQIEHDEFMSNWLRNGNVMHAAIRFEQPESKWWIWLLSQPVVTGAVNDEFRRQTQVLLDSSIRSNPSAGLPYASGLLRHECYGKGPRQIDTLDPTAVTKLRMQWDREQPPYTVIGYRRIKVPIPNEIRDWADSQERNTADPNFRRFKELQHKHLEHAKDKGRKSQTDRVHRQLVNNRRFVFGKGDDETPQGGAAVPYTYGEYVFFDERFTSQHTDEEVRQYHRQLDDAFANKRAQLEAIRRNCRPHPDTGESWETKLKEAMNLDYVEPFEPLRNESISLVRETTQGGPTRKIEDRGHDIVKQMIHEIGTDLAINAATRRQRISRLKRNLQSDDQFWEDAMEQTFRRPDWRSTANKQRDGLYALLKLNRQPARVHFLMDLDELAGISRDGVFADNADAVLDAAMTRAALQIEGDQQAILDSFQDADLRKLTFRWPSTKVA